MAKDGLDSEKGERPLFTAIHFAATCYHLPILFAAIRRYSQLLFAPPALLVAIIVRHYCLPLLSAAYCSYLPLSLSNLSSCGWPSTTGGQPSTGIPSARSSQCLIQLCAISGQFPHRSEQVPEKSTAQVWHNIVKAPWQLSYKDQLEISSSIN